MTVINPHDDWKKQFVERESEITNEQHAAWNENWKLKSSLGKWKLACAFFILLSLILLGCSLWLNYINGLQFEDNQRLEQKVMLAQ